MPRTINFLVIHCSATPNGRWTTVSDINAWHRARKFTRNGAARALHQPMLDAIGYHWVIYTNGNRVPGRSHDEVGAHAFGFNTHSLGICLVGTDRFSDAQWATLAELVRQLCQQYHIPMQFADPKDPRGLRGVIGHGQLPDVMKACPGFDVRKWLSQGLTPDSSNVQRP